MYTHRGNIPSTLVFLHIENEWEDLQVDSNDLQQLGHMALYLLLTLEEAKEEEHYFSWQAPHFVSLISFSFRLTAGKNRTFKHSNVVKSQATFKCPL